MGSVHEDDTVPTDLPAIAETEQVEVMPVESTLQQDLVPEPVQTDRLRLRIIKMYSRRAAGTVVSDTKELPTADRPCSMVQKVILHINDPRPPVSPSAAEPPVPPSPTPSGGDHSLDGDYLEECPTHIWVNSSRSHRKLRMDRQHLDDGAVRVRPVCSADTALVRVVNLSAHARGQAPRFTRDTGNRALDILFVSHGSLDTL